MWWGSDPSVAPLPNVALFNGPRLHQWQSALATDRLPQGKGGSTEHCEASHTNLTVRGSPCSVNGAVLMVRAPMRFP